jgi:hypothetical protein
MEKEPSNQSPFSPSRQTIQALRLLFWCGILYILDFNLSCGGGDCTSGFDIFTDIIGLILISIGIFKLDTEEVLESYSEKMWFIKLASLLAIIIQIIPWSRIPALDGVDLILGVIIVIAIGTFSQVMHSLSRDQGFSRSEHLWKKTHLAVIAVYVIPTCLFSLLSLVIIILNRFSLYEISYHSLHPAIAVILLVSIPVFFLPLVLLFLATNKLKSEILQRIELKEPKKKDA